MRFALSLSMAVLVGFIAGWSVAPSEIGAGPVVDRVTDSLPAPRSRPFGERPAHLHPSETKEPPQRPVSPTRIAQEAPRATDRPEAVDPRTGLPDAVLGRLVIGLHIQAEGRRMALLDLASGDDPSVALDRVAETEFSREARAATLLAFLRAELGSDAEVAAVLLRVKDYCESEWARWCGGRIPPPGCVPQSVAFQIYDLLCR